MGNDHINYEEVDLYNCRLDKNDATGDHTLPSHIIGFDDLLRGGFRLPGNKKGLILIIKGLPGTGKTTMALQLAKGACRWEISDLVKDTMPVSIFSNEQDDEDIKAILKDRLREPRLVSKTNDKYELLEPKANSIQPDPVKLTNIGTPEDVLSPLSSNISWAYQVLSSINEEKKIEKHRMIVIDGLNLLSSEERHRFEVEALVKILREKALISVLVYESKTDGTGHIDYLADMIVELRGDVVKGTPEYFLQHLCIVKSRFQQSALGWHQYKIRRNTGLRIYPSIHFHVHQNNLLEERLQDSMYSLVPGISGNGKTNYVNKNNNESKPLPVDTSALMRILGSTQERPMMKGSITMVLGARRTWKTMLTMDFLRAGSHPGKQTPTKGEHCLLVSLSDNQSSIVKHPTELCQWCCQNGKNDLNAVRSCDRGCYRNVHLFHFRPGCISSSEFFHYLHKRLALAEVEEKPITRLVFWDLTQLEYRFPLLANDVLFIPALMDYLKNTKQITSVFMGAANSKLALAASAMADNVVFAWQDNYHGELDIPPTRKGSQEWGNGFAFHVDRLDGHPETGRLFFLPADEKEEREPKHSYTELIGQVKDVEKNIDKFTYAESMRENIWAIQGLEARRQSNEKK